MVLLGSRVSECEEELRRRAVRRPLGTRKSVLRVRRPSCSAFASARSARACALRAAACARFASLRRSAVVRARSVASSGVRLRRLRALLRVLDRALRRLELAPRVPLVGAGDGERLPVGLRLAAARRFAALFLGDPSWEARRRGAWPAVRRPSRRSRRSPRAPSRAGRRGAPRPSPRPVPLRAASPPPSPAGRRRARRPRSPSWRVRRELRHQRRARAVAASWKPERSPPASSSSWAARRSSPADSSSSRSFLRRRVSWFSAHAATVGLRSALTALAASRSPSRTQLLRARVARARELAGRQPVQLLRRLLDQLAARPRAECSKFRSGGRAGSVADQPREGLRASRGLAGPRLRAVRVGHEQAAAVHARASGAARAPSRASGGPPTAGASGRSRAR